MPLLHRFSCSTRSGGAGTRPAGVVEGPGATPAPLPPGAVPAHPARPAIRQQTIVTRNRRYNRSPLRAPDPT
jgi:hypothetical protein